MFSTSELPLQPYFLSFDVILNILVDVIFVKWTGLRIMFVAITLHITL